MVKKYFVPCVASLVVGFLAGGYWAGSSTEDSMAIGLAADLIWEDKMLSLLEQNEIEAAKRAHREYLHAKLIEEQGLRRNWPPNVQAVLERHRELLRK